MANHLRYLLFIFFLTNFSLSALLPASSSPTTTTTTSPSLPLNTLHSKPAPPDLGLHYPEILAPHQQQQQQDAEEEEEETDSSTIKPRQEAEPAASLNPPVAPPAAPVAAAPTNADPIPVAGGGSIPAITDRPEVNLEKQGYRQETYYTCKTRDGRESCGWHEPLVEIGGGERAGGKVGIVGVVVAGVMGGFVMGLL